MSKLGRVVLLAMVPVNLLLVIWVWIGRLLFGSGGWVMVVMVVTVLPVLLIALLVTTILGFSAHRRPRSLTASQAAAQLVMWAGMLVFGFFIVDFGDTDESISSVFSRLVGNGDSAQSISWIVAGISGLVVVAAWVVLLAQLIGSRRSARASYAVPA